MYAPIGLEDRFEEYPKLKELIRLKDEQIAKYASPPMCVHTNLLIIHISNYTWYMFGINVLQLFAAFNIYMLIKLAYDFLPECCAMWTCLCLYENLSYLD